MSSGLTAPRLARLSVRTSVIVITIVTSTTRVAPKLRASSLRKDEWNNIARSSRTKRETRIMDFQLKTLDAAGAAREKCDALVLVVGAGYKPGKDPLSRLAAGAVEAGGLG